MSSILPNKHPNTAATQRRNAERKRCPKCGRGAALVSVPDLGEYGGLACRWALEKKCDYVRLFDR